MRSGLGAGGEFGTEAEGRSEVTVGDVDCTEGKGTTESGDGTPAGMSGLIGDKRGAEKGLAAPEPKQPVVEQQDGMHVDGAGGPGAALATSSWHL